jgi:hypothetical protein
MTRRGRHRADTHPDTLDGDAAFFGLTHTQREHYTDRNFTHRWTHRPHHGEQWAFLYWAAGWCTITIGTVLLLWWVMT